MEKKYTLVSLFSGAGGLDMGFKNAGFNVLWANDIDKDACETHKLWSKSLVVCGDIGKIDLNTIPSSDVIAGGFPCLVGDSLIFTKNGYKKIIDIKKGDMVLSHDRKYHKVLNFFNQGKKEVYKITSNYFKEIRATINHRFFVRKKENGMFLPPNFYSIETILKEGFENFYFCNVSNKISSSTECEYIDLDNDYEDLLFLYSRFPSDILEDFLTNFFIRNDCFETIDEGYLYEFCHLIIKGLKCSYNVETVGNSFILRKEENDESFYENGYLWFPIKNIVEDGLEFVYDIEVENSHSFVVNGCISHNCQGFSLAGPRKLDDSRNTLYKHFVNLVECKKPKIFIAENVKGLLSMGEGTIIEAIIEDFKTKGYRVNTYLINAKDYEVPQDRQRVIIIGIRNDIVKEFKFPEKINKKITLKEALKGLKEANDDEVCMEGFSSRYMSRNRKRDWDEVSFTIPAQAKQVALHPSSPNMEKLGTDLWKFGEGKTRRLSYKEASLIQTFPKGMIFCGNLNSKYKQIGNAVPVKLAEHIAKSIYSFLENLED